MKLQKGWLVYGVVLVALLLGFVCSPRFGWYLRDSYGSCWLHYAGSEQEGASRTIRYQGSGVELRITETKGTERTEGTEKIEGIGETKGYRIEYKDKRKEGETPEAWEAGSSQELRNVPFGVMPDSIKSIGDTLYQQDKQERGAALYLAVFFLGTASLLAVWYGLQQSREPGRVPNVRLRQEIGLLFGMMLLVLYAGSCLRITHWGWLDVFLK